MTGRAKPVMEEAIESVNFSASINETLKKLEKNYLSECIWVNGKLPWNKEKKVGMSTGILKN